MNSHARKPQAERELSDQNGLKKLTSASVMDPFSPDNTRFSISAL